MNEQIENAIKELNENPSRDNLNKLKKLLKEFSDKYQKEFGYVPVIHIDQLLTGLSGEVINLYRNELPFSQKEY